MVPIAKIIVVMSCGVMLCLSLSNATQAAEKIKTDPCADRQGGQPNFVKCNEETRQGIDTVTGEVLRINGNDFLVQRFNGKEVRLHLDANTQMTEIIGLGDRIEAKVGNMDDQKHAMSIRQLEE
jgi:hypothetical protein